MANLSPAHTSIHHRVLPALTWHRVSVLFFVLNSTKAHSTHHLFHPSNVGMNGKLYTIVIKSCIRLAVYVRASSRQRAGKECALIKGDSNVPENGSEDTSLAY